MITTVYTRRQIFGLGLGALAVASGCGPTEAPLPRPIVTGPPPRRVRYGKGEDQFADLYRPEGRTPLPVVVLIHGGFWGATYRLDLMEALAQALRAEGVAVWNIEYRRLGGQGGWPATFRDVALAVDHLRVIARAEQLDLQHVACVGHSAGGHLALWAAGRAHLAEGSELWVRWPRPLRGVVALAPIPDLRRAYAQGFDIVGKLLGGSPDAVPERYAAASPAELLPLDASQVLLHGTADRQVPFALSEAYVSLARGKGDAVTLVPLKGLGHFEPIDPLSAAWPSVRQAVLASIG